MRDLDLEERLNIFPNGNLLLKHIDDVLAPFETSTSEVYGTETNPIALVLIDINMDDMNGIECVK